MGMTKGGLDLSGSVIPGENTEIKGYVDITRETDFIGDRIWISVREGQEKEDLFQNGSAVITSYTDGWVPGGNGKRNEKNGIVSFMLVSEDPFSETGRVSFGIRGIISEPEGDSDVILMEEDTESGLKNDPLTITVNKAQGFLESTYFIAAKRDAPTEPCCFFRWGEPVLFKWDGSGGGYRILENGNDGVVYEGTEHSFQYEPGIGKGTSVFILETIREGKPVQYQTLTLQEITNDNVITAAAVLDGKGVNFLFEQLDDQTITYWYCNLAEQILSKSGKLACRGKRVLEQYDLLCTDRLPDGRVIVLSGTGGILCYQIQKEAGKPGFCKMQTYDFSGGERSALWLDTGIVNISTALTTDKLYIFITYYHLTLNDEKELEEKSGVFYMEVTGKEGALEIKKLCGLFKNGESIGDYAVGTHSWEEMAEFYLADYNLNQLLVYDMAQKETPVVYSPQEGVDIKSLAGMKDGKKEGVFCTIYAHDHDDVGKVILDKKTKTFSIKTINTECIRWMPCLYMPNGKEEVYIFIEKKERTPEGYPQYFFALCDGSGEYEFQDLVLLGKLMSPINYYEGEISVVTSVMLDEIYKTIEPTKYWAEHTRKRGLFSLLKKRTG